MRNVIFVLLCFTAYPGHAGDVKYPVSAIPDEMKKGMNAVVREDMMVYKITARNRAGLHSIHAITIFNEKGERYLDETFFYDKLSLIKELKGSVYDASGKLIRKLKSSEIRDQSAYDGFSLYSDNRHKIIDLTQSIYPYTVEVELVMEYKFLYSIDGTYILPGGRVSVQHASYQLIYPPELKPRVKVLNLEKNLPRVEQTSDGFESMSWSFENFMPMEFEPMGPNSIDLLPHIIAAPSEFEYEGYVGNMSTWEEYGKWNLQLNRGRDQLPESTRQKVRELTRNLTTKEQKAKALYEYLQSKTRYVSIQLGIGGLQPFGASVVDELGYGDCKALSNYMVAILKEIGVEAYYTTVHAGPNNQKVMLDFPSHQSNHVIVAVPNGADTLWLECTSQTDPFGYQGTFTGDRKALMITENGGKIVNTTRYPAELNREYRVADVFVNTSGDAKAQIRTVYAGLQYENGGLNFHLGNQYDDQKKWVQKNTDIPSFDINSFSITDKKEKIPSATVTLDLILNRYATVSGKRLFLTPNLMNRSTFIPEKVENRKTNVVLTYIPFTDIDSVRFHLPENIYPEFLPETISIKSQFGEYQASFKIDQGNVLYVRKMVRTNGEFPADSYNQLIDFYKSINKADHIKLVFLNKT